MRSPVWDRLARSYDRLYSGEWSRLEDALVEKSLAKIKGRVIDLGCGTGLGASLLPPETEYVGVDISARMIDHARRKFPRHAFAVLDAADLSSFGDESFDGVISLHHPLSLSGHPERIASESMRVLRPGGRLFFMVAARYSLKRLLALDFRRKGRYCTRGTSRPSLEIEIKYFSPPELMELFASRGASALKIGAISAFGDVCEWPPIWRLDRAICRAIPYLGYTTILEGVKYAL